MAFEAHPNLVTPPDDTVLWRYLDFAKFMSLLERRVLWFARLDTIEDPLEGTYTDGELRHFASLPPLETALGSEELKRSFLRGTAIMRSTALVNCWRAGADESMAMWDIYGRGGGGVAIKSAVGLVKRAVSALEGPVYIGEVKYVDWDEAAWDNNLLAMCVRKVFAYRHESEVRALIWGLNSANRDLRGAVPLGIEVPFDPAQFVTEVWIGPRAGGESYNLVKQLMRRYGLQQPVIASRLLQARS